MSFKEVFIEGQLKLTIINLNNNEVLVSADVAAIPWCYKVDYEMSIDNVGILYTFLEIPDVGKVELVGSNVADSIKVINIKYKVREADLAVDTYHRIVKYITDYCGKV